MTKFLIVGGSPLSGIGQVCMKYAEMLKRVHGYHSEYKFFREAPTTFDDWDRVLMFVIPETHNFAYLDSVASFDKVELMTVCETEPVHADYGKLLRYKKNIWTPSEYARKVLANQFPSGKFDVLRHWTYRPHIDESNIDPGFKKMFSTNTYKFYTIGNMLDGRKNFRALLESWMQSKMYQHNCELVIKSTAQRSFSLELPGVHVINGLVDDAHIGYIHKHGDCFVNFSHSEGVGMGAFEASVWGNPVIITNWGGPIEYVKTNYVIGSQPTKLKNDDFLFLKGTTWGEPNRTDLVRYFIKIPKTPANKKHARKILNSVETHKVFRV
jgi:glycosyltransferase involved in cell wall biosynthesis